MAAADLAPPTSRNTHMDEHRIAVMMDEFSKSLTKITEEHFSKMRTIFSENQKQMHKLFEQCFAIINDGAREAHSHEDPHLSVPVHSDNADSADDFNCDDADVIPGLGLVEDETDVVVSAEQKNSKTPVSALDLFDESPKKNRERYFVWCKISDEQRKVLDCVHDTYKLDLDGNDLVYNSRIVSTFGAFPRVKLKFNVLFTNKITTGLKIIIKYSIHGPVDHKLVDKNTNKAVPMFWTAIGAGTSSSMVTPHLFNIIQCLVETDAYKTLSNADEEMMEYGNQQRRNIFEADDVFEIIMKNAARLDSVILYDRDFDYDDFGFKTLERSYLLKIEGKVVERPQHMLMRISVGIHKDDIDSAIQTYHLMSQRWFTHASPTLFNAGTPRPQLSSCFLVCMRDDSIEGIYDTLKESAVISKLAGEIGVSVLNIRVTGSYIRGTNGTYNGIVPMLRVFNDTARYVGQGGGKRKGTFAVYLEPWHAEIYDFLDLRKNHGTEANRARDLIYALWIPDLFMDRVQSNGEWSLLCPNEAPGLADCWGQEFENLYIKYEREGKAKKVVQAQTLWFEVFQFQIETGTPYMLFKDTCNRKSNQQDMGTIKSSNWCTEIIFEDDFGILHGFKNTKADLILLHAANMLQFIQLVSNDKPRDESVIKAAVAILGDRGLNFLSYILITTLRTRCFLKAWGMIQLMQVINGLDIVVAQMSSTQDNQPMCKRNS